MQGSGQPSGCTCILYGGAPRPTPTHFLSPVLNSKIRQQAGGTAKRTPHSWICPPRPMLASTSGVFPVLRLMHSLDAALNPMKACTTLTRLSWRTGLGKFPRAASRCCLWRDLCTVPACIEDTVDKTTKEQHIGKGGAVICIQHRPYSRRIG